MAGVGRFLLGAVEQNPADFSQHVVSDFEVHRVALKRSFYGREVMCRDSSRHPKLEQVRLRLIRNAQALLN